MHLPSRCSTSSVPHLVEHSTNPSIDSGKEGKQDWRSSAFSYFTDSIWKFTIQQETIHSSGVVENLSNRIREKL